MSDDINSKYGGNARNLWRKVYGYQNNKPQMVSVVDSITQTTYSLDLNKTLRHRDFFIIQGLNSGSQTLTTESAFVTAEYDEGLFHFSSITDHGTGSFNFTFSSLPIVVLSVESASLYGGGVNLFGGNITTSGFTFATSAPFSGSIRWRAIYATSYPAVCSSSYTASITASTGPPVIPLGSTAYTASFATLPGVPFSFRDTSWENVGIVTTGFGDVAFTHETSSSSTATVEISAPAYSTIEFIAFYDANPPVETFNIITDIPEDLVTDTGDNLVWG
jgi:hypothetical protein